MAESPVAVPARPLITGFGVVSVAPDAGAVIRRPVGAVASTVNVRGADVPAFPARSACAAVAV